MGGTKHGTQGAHISVVFRLILSLASYGAAILLIHRIPIAINEPAVFVLLFTLRDLYLARVYSGISTKLNLPPRRISPISLKVQDPESQIPYKRKRTVPYLSDSKPNGRVP